MKLTAQDKKFLREEMRAGYVFSAIILCFGGIFNLLYFAVNENSGSVLFIVIADLVICCASVLVFYLMNRKLIKDLKAGTKRVVIAHIENKEEAKSYEAGSGNLNIPILGDIFPKLWGQKMKENTVYYLIVQNRKFEVEKSLYDKAMQGDTVEIYYSEYSELLLGIENANVRNSEKETT